MILERKIQKIIIAEDHELLRQGLQLLIGQLANVELVGLATNGVEAVSLAIEHIPDLALLDWHMPRSDGLQAAKEIKRYVSGVKTLVFSSLPVNGSVLDALDDGVDGFIHTDVSLDTLEWAIRSLCNGQRYLSPQVTTALLNRNRLSVNVDAEGIKLSSRELEVLRLMATSATYADMAEHLIIGETTVRTYVRRIFSKLQQPNRTLAVVEGIRRNLISIDAIP